MKEPRTVHRKVPQDRNRTNRVFVSVYPIVNHALSSTPIKSIFDGLSSWVDGFQDFEDVCRSPLTAEDQDFVATHNDWAMVGQDMLVAMRSARGSLDDEIKDKLPAIVVRR